MPFLLSLDLKLFFFINQQGTGRFLDALMLFITFLGSVSWIWVIPWLYLLYKSSSRDRRVLFLLIPLIMVTDLFPTYIFKPYFMRPRPFLALDEVRLLLPPTQNISQYGFFSNHASNIFGIAVFLSLRYRKAWLSGILLLIAALVGTSRVYLGFHYPSDVFSGALFGSAAGFFFFWLSRKIIGNLGP